MDTSAYLYRKLIPDYWFDIVDNPQSFEECDQYLDARIKAIPQGKSFVFITDPHCFMAHKRPLDPINVMNSTAIIGYVRAMTGIKKVVMGGDVIERGANKFLGLQEFLIYNNEMIAMAGKDYLVVHGNHDQNTPNIPTDKEAIDSFMIPYTVMNQKLFSHIPDRVCEDEGIILAKLEKAGATEEQKKEYLAYSKLHYYVDDNEAKVRYIMIDSGSPGCGRNGVVEELFGVYNNGEMILQYDFVASALMGVPQDYDVVIAGHALLGYEGNTKISDVMLGICKILSSYKTKSKVSVRNIFTGNSKVEKYYDGGVHEYDFTNAKGSGNAVIVAADIHIDVQTKADYDENGNFVSSPYEGEVLPATAVVVNATQTDCIWGQVKKNIERNNPMEKGTHTEQCFDVVTFLDNGNIRFTRIGAGKDREVRYK